MKKIIYETQSSIFHWITLVLISFSIPLLAQDEWQIKVEADLLNELSAGGFTIFYVYLYEEPDLSEAYEIDNWDERGWFVFNILTENAERTQVPILTLLEQQTAASYVNHYKSYWIINCIEVEGNINSIVSLASMEQVKSIEYPKQMELIDGLLEDSEDGNPDAVEWNIQKILAPEVWANFGVTGQGIVVGNIDTGVEYNHPALINQYRGNLGGGQFDHNYNWYDPTGTYPNFPGDNHSHGTHVMGISVGSDGGSNQIGVAPGAKWIAAKGCEGPSCSHPYLLSALQFMLSPTNLSGNNPDPTKRPHVINNSWGGCIFHTTFRTAVSNLRAAGILCVFSAGNTGGNCPSVPSCYTIGTPGTYKESFAVGNTTSTDEISNTSLWGPSVDPTEPNVIKPEVSAPGTNIRSSIPGGSYGPKSGTSMAAPHVTGLVALLLSKYNSLIGQVSSLENIISTSAQKFSYATNCGNEGPNNIPNNAYGYGRIDALNAMYETIYELAKQNLSISQTATAYNNGRRLVRDGASYLHLVFASGGQIFYRKRTPWGEWFQTTKISDGSLNDFPCIVVSNSGDLYAAWQRKTSTNTYEIVFAMSMDWGETWSAEDRYVLTTVTSSLDPLPVIQSDIQGYSKVIAYKTNSGLKSYWTNWHYPYSLNWTYYSVSTNSNDSYPTLSSENGTPQKSVLAYQNSSDGKIYYKYFTTSWSAATNLSNIVPGSGVHQTPTITNIPGSTQLHVAWKKLIGTGSTIYDHLVVHRRATNYNTWPNEWFGTYYNCQEYPSITGLATNNVNLLYQTPPQFGTPYIYKMSFTGNQWGGPVFVATNGRYPSVSSGQTTANYVWTSGSTSPYTVSMGTGLSKETVVDPIDYYARSIALLDSNGSYLEIKIHNIAFEFTDGSNQKLNYAIAGLDGFNMTIQNCYDSLASTLLSVIPLNARKLTFDISVSGVGINNLFGNTGYIPVSMKLINNQNVTLRSIQNNFNVLNGTLPEIRRTFTIPLTGLGIIPGVTQIRANLKLLNPNPAVGVFASLGHIFDYTSLLENPQENIRADNQVSSIAEEPSIQNYPNPFNPITQIKYSIVKDGLVTLKVYDVLGREIKTLVNEEKQVGTYNVQFDASNLSSGIYFYSITTGVFHQTKKMILIR